MLSFTNAMRDLAKKPFQCSEFEQIINKMKTYTTGHLRDMVVQDGNLLGHLKVTDISESHQRLSMIISYCLKEISFKRFFTTRETCWLCLQS